MQGWKLDGAEIGSPAKVAASLKLLLGEILQIVFFCNICRVVLGARGTDHLEVATATQEELESYRNTVR